VVLDYGQAGPGNSRHNTQDNHGGDSQCLQGADARAGARLNPARPIGKPGRRGMLHLPPRRLRPPPKLSLTFTTPQPAGSIYPRHAGTDATRTIGGNACAHCAGERGDWDARLCLIRPENGTGGQLGFSLSNCVRTHQRTIQASVSARGARTCPARARFCIAKRPIALDFAFHHPKPHANPTPPKNVR